MTSPIQHWGGGELWEGGDSNQFYQTNRQIVDLTIQLIHANTKGPKPERTLGNREKL